MLSGTTGNLKFLVARLVDMQVGDLVRWRRDMALPENPRWRRVCVITFVDSTFVRVNSEPGLIGRGNFQIVSKIENR